MIQSIPNPTMTQDEIRQFRLEMLRRMKGNFTEEERRAAQKRKRSKPNYEKQWRKESYPRILTF